MNKYTHRKSNSVCFTQYSTQSGFSLIEILVAAVILSIGILGVAGLQIVGLKGTQQSVMKLQAMSVVQNLTERMRSNTQGVLSGNYELPNSDAFDCGLGSIPNCSSAGASCSSQDIATADLHNLVCGYQSGGASRTGGLRSIAADDITSFVGGKLTVGCTDSGNCASGNMTIEVNWTEREIVDGIGDPEDFLIINTRISP